MYSSGVQKIKKALGLGFEASEMGVVIAVEEQATALEDIKAVLGLPPEARPQQISDAVRALKEEKAGFWSTLFKR